MSALEFVTPDSDLVDRIRQGLRAHVSANATNNCLHVRLATMSVFSITSSSTLELEPPPVQKAAAVPMHVIPALRLVTSYKEPIEQNLKEIEAVS